MNPNEPSLLPPPTPPVQRQQPVQPVPPAQPVQQPSSKKQPPDEKTVEALLAITRADAERAAKRKAEDMSNAPPGLMSRYVYKTVHTLNPDNITSSPRIQRKAIFIVLGVVLSIIISIVASHYLGPLGSL